MDFDPALERAVHGLKCYQYEPLSPELLPPLYLAYHNQLSEPTEVFHNDIRGRFNRGEPKVVDAMKRLAEITRQGREAISTRDYATLARLMDDNFEVRRSIYNLPPWQVRMVEAARECGACANFAGSGGAVVGTYTGEEMYAALCARMAAIGSAVVKVRL
jgi:glucuronokinase